jgi:hypothetical protein
MLCTRNDSKRIDVSLSELGSWYIKERFHRLIFKCRMSGVAPIDIGAGVSQLINGEKETALYGVHRVKSAT